MDLCAPLLHEFTYQAMCNDLLEVLDGQKYMSVTLPQRLRSANVSGVIGIRSETSKEWRKRRRRC